MKILQSSRDPGGPRHLNPKESFTLRYRVIVHPDLWSGEKLKEALASYAGDG